jgi:hypothetical protein
MNIEALQVGLQQQQGEGREWGNIVHTAAGEQAHDMQLTASLHASHPGVSNVTAGAQAPIAGVLRASP